MRTVRKLLILVALTMLLILPACGGAASETAVVEAGPEPADFAPVVSATGEVTPEREALLSVETGGVVAEVLVAEGALVYAGDVLVRLEGAEQLQAAVSAAQLELANAQYALDALYEDTDLLAAQALQAAESAERALEDLNNLELQQALAGKAVADAQKAVDDTDRRLRYLQSNASQADIDAAHAQLVLAKDALDKAKEDFEPYADKPEDNLARANYQARLAAAQQSYDAALRKYNAMTGTGSEIDINVARADFAAAQAQLLEAQRELERVNQGPKAGDVALLEAQIDKGYGDYETYRAGPDPDDVALAQARVANAASQLAAAEAALADLELVAPFDGSVAALHIHASEWVSPGQPVLLLADLAHLQVETTDLNEIDAARVQVGAKATITFDALPDLVIEGAVVRMAPKAAEGSGVNYPVIVQLSQVPPALRWGMTAFVDIEIEE